MQTPVAYLTCNFSAPVGGKPACFTHDEVITLFHEFGHGLHHMLTRVDELGVSGINGVEWDAVELPSQFMENFCWEWDVLTDMSAHVETGATLPRELFDKMLAAKNFQSGLGTLRQIVLSMFDIQLHSDYDPAGATNVNDFAREINERFHVVPQAPFSRWTNTFTHIFAGGYAAGYYSYKWAEVLSADAYAAFEEAAKLAGGQCSMRQRASGIVARFLKWAAAGRRWTRSRRSADVSRISTRCCGITACRRSAGALRLGWLCDAVCMIEEDRSSASWNGFFMRLSCGLARSLLAIQPEIHFLRPPFQAQLRPHRRRTAHHLAAAKHRRARRTQSNRFDRITRVQHHAIRVVSHGNPISFDTQDLRRRHRHRVEAARIASMPVICATCNPMCATSSMSPEPRLYHGSITQSWPNATSTPAAIISGTRVMPRRFG